MGNKKGIGYARGHTLYLMIGAYRLLQLKEGGEGLAGVFVVDDGCGLAH